VVLQHPPVGLAEVSRDEQMDRMAALYRELLAQGGR